MAERVIRISRELWESLPALYQTIAKIGEKSGQVVIADGQNLAEEPEQDHENELVSLILKSRERDP